ncbi:hypothetical protein CPB83DRAFT_843334 [Crepidotus variabilis]|uniref:F-box domain-containing protein n=1 Tax=Crepidotus variabilis TaxID=179855 RepID=A0A9P6ETQ4_9AGAR|nr:hypothetical protein CPB83DRAFT_843334 [Crepidotus variabilis]
MARLEIPLENLVPEIYPIIASHLPLHATPSTLLSLALINRYVHQIVMPILHSRLILKNESDAIAMLQKLAENPTFGRVVRELHIMSNLSKESRRQNPPVDVIQRVQDVILHGNLPFLHSLDLQILHVYYYHENTSAPGLGQLRKEFCKRVKEQCPRLKCFHLEGFQDYNNSGWMEESGCFEVTGLTSLTVKMTDQILKKSGRVILFKHISSLATSLHTLHLRLGANSPFDSGTFINPPSPILELNFPHLRSLSLSSFFPIDTEQSTAFFIRHPSLEYLDITTDLMWYAKSIWIASTLPSEFLPKLRHLRAGWKDVRVLAPILHLLITLSIHNSVNGQIPYLLRKVIPTGLPKLRSLGIGQWESNACPYQDSALQEGQDWCETSEGKKFQVKRGHQSRTVFDNYMHSVVRGAPNLEEIAFYRDHYLSSFPSIADRFNKLSLLKRLFYRSFYERTIVYERTIAEREEFIKEATTLMQAVPALESISNAYPSHLPFLEAKAERSETGILVGVNVGEGFGMTVGYDDDAFPWAPANGQL